MTSILVPSYTSGYATESRKTVVILDTGLDLEDPRFKSILCSSGHKDFSGTGINDKNGHGTHVLGLVTLNAPRAGWCAIIVSFFSNKKSSQILSDYDKAIEYIGTLKPDFVNISGGGHYVRKSDQTVIKKLTNTKFIVAAGNNSENLSISKQDYFPAEYPYLNVIPVGNLNKDGTKAKTSNYGIKTMVWEIGEDQMSTLPIWQGGFGEMSGTSMATAVHTGKLIKASFQK